VARLSTFSTTKESGSGIEQWNLSSHGLVVVEAEKLVHGVVEQLGGNSQVKLAEVQKVNFKTIELLNRHASNASPTWV
jgi:hypothetical protein